MYDVYQVYLRDDIRYGVEVCSVRRMRAGMEARGRLTRLYGFDLCAEETVAVNNMMRMFAMVQGCGTDSTDNTVKDNDEDKDDDDDDQEDTKLPPFVREQLDLMKQGKQLEQTVNQFKLLVPSFAKRAQYLRMFKWVVSFATWTYGTTAAAASSTTSSLRSSDNSNNNTAAAAVTMNFVNSNQLSRKGALLMIASLDCSPDSGPTYGGGSISHSHSYSPAGKGGKGAVMTSASASASPAAKLNKPNTLTPRKSQSLTGNGHGHAALTKFSANVAMKSKYGRETTREINALSLSSSDKAACKSIGSQDMKEVKPVAAAAAATFIPFSQRQSKAVVASHASLKKSSANASAKEKVFSADALIENTMKDYNQFYKKHIPESKW